MASRTKTLLRLLADERNQAILEVLDDGTEERSVTAIAEALVDRENTAFDGVGRGTEVERAKIRLHHRNLPALAAADLITYDRDRRVVSAPPGGPSERLDIEHIDELLSHVRTAPGTDGGSIDVLEGSDQVYERARRFADEAESELFLIYVSDDLLDVGCLPQARAAIDRGVTFAVGSRDGAVHDFFDEHLPEATLWEPQRDWGGNRTQYPRVNRVIVADRERVVVGLLNGAGEDGERTETAMVGEGAANPLVVLVRELLGPRLDHLDYQSEEFLQRLPFDS